MHSEIISLTEFKNDAASWIKRLETQPPIILTQNGRGRAVVQNYEAFRQMQAELALLRRVRVAEDDLATGRTCSTDEAFKNAERVLHKKLGGVDA